jgi:hypothetical protein
MCHNPTAIEAAFYAWMKNGVVDWWLDYNDQAGLNALMGEP